MSLAIHLRVAPHSNHSFSLHLLSLPSQISLRQRSL
jgi:hypothetical protein